MNLSNLKYAHGSRKNVKRIGRGEGSGHGGTSTKGHKGLKSRSGNHMKSWFEGGQMPLQRRLPKFGFVNLFKTEFQTVNVGSLEKFNGSRVDVSTLYASGLIKSKTAALKILGHGDLSRKLDIQAHAVSESAKAKIEKAGGTVTVLGIKKTLLVKPKKNQTK